MTPRRYQNARDDASSEPDLHIDEEALRRALEAFSDHEGQITERFYEIFFEKRPDTRELFGVHSIAEREEMMRETLRSIEALLENHDWLAGNLDALGRSHWEYGVTEDMYPSFVECLIDCGHEVLGGALDEAALASFRAATWQIAEQMRVAGEAAMRTKTRA
jgi:hemoglobin-like flavoprotein